ncbi:hypothetical protein ACVWZR_000019 [Bradyrhizobium sp. i1.3.1]
MAEQDVIDAVRSRRSRSSASLTRPRRQDGTATRSRREQLQRLWPPQRQQALTTGGDSRHGPRSRDRGRTRRRRRCDQIISAEEPDAQEVDALIKKVGRTALAIPGDLRMNHSARSWSSKTVQGLGGLDIIVSKRRPTADPRLYPRRLIGRFRRDHEDQRLHAVLDHEGRAAPSQARLLYHRHDIRTGLRSFL